MSRRIFLRTALALLTAPAVLAAAGCGGVEQPTKFTENPTGPLQGGAGGGKAKGKAGPDNTQTD
jgi:hypothetical protein